MATCGVTMGFVESAQAQDAQAKKWEKLVQEKLGIFVVVPKWRDASSEIKVVGGQLQIAVRRRVERNERKAAICLGARWLLTGRLEETQGALAVFRTEPDLNSIRLTFYDVKTSVEPDRQRGYRQSRTIIQQARFLITKDRAQKLDRTVLRKNLKGETCMRVAQGIE